MSKLLCGKKSKKDKRSRSPAYGSKEEASEEKARLIRQTERLKEYEEENQRLKENLKDEQNKSRVWRQENADLKQELKNAKSKQDLNKATEEAPGSPIPTMASNQEASVFPENEMKKIQNAAKGGVSGIDAYFKQKNEEWKNIPLNIGITGEAGVGKSSFINAVRGLTADDEGGAHVNVVEATLKVTQYQHPNNQSCVFWDLPGVGTPTFPRDKYLDVVQLDRFDFFLILSAGRFRDHDLWLAKQIRLRKKNFHFVRTQMQVDIDKDRKSHPKTHDRRAVIAAVRKDCADNLAKNGITDADVFLIDNYALREFDFEKLMVQLIEDTPALKKEAIVLSMAVLTDGVIEKKYEALHQRIYRVAILSAVSGALPIPGAGVALDTALLVTEVKFYQKQLGLDADTMKEYSIVLHKDPDQLVESLGLSLLTATTRGINIAISATVASEVIEKTLPIVFPFVGSMISAGLSYGTSVATLKNILSQLFSDAKKINNALIKNMQSNSTTTC